jgi:hypothetical protein
MNTPPTESPRFVTCHCEHCNERIEFDASDFQTGEMRNAECPHCHLETTLSVPSKSEQDAALAASLPIQTKSLPASPPPIIAEVQQEQFEKRKITQIKTLLRARLQSGKPAFLYDTVYVPVDSQILDEEFASDFDVSILRKLGLLGWDVVQVVPKTKGIALENIGTDTLMSSVYGGGIGGNIMGVHIIIKKSLSACDLTDDPADEVGEFIRNHLADFID